jgi:hypothetical protein
MEDKMPVEIIHPFEILWQQGHIPAENGDERIHVCFYLVIPTVSRFICDSQPVNADSGHVAQ